MEMFQMAHVATVDLLKRVHIETCPCSGLAFFSLFLPDFIYCVGHTYQKIEHYAFRLKGLLVSYMYTIRAI